MYSGSWLRCDDCGHGLELRGKMGYQAYNWPYKYMNEPEFVDEGYMLEANRQFFHPLGLQLVAQLCDDGGLRLRVMDHRAAPAGLTYRPEDPEWMEVRRWKVENVGRAWEERARARVKRYGFIIQPREQLWDPNAAVDEVADHTKKVRYDA